MADFFSKISTYFGFEFVVNAFIVGLLIALCASLLGITLVLKRYSFIGTGLSNVAFGAMSIAGILHFTNDMPLTLGITVLAAILLLRTGSSTKTSGDASIAIISVSSMALGYLLLNLFSSSGNLSGDVCSTLFGSTSILTLSKTQVYLCIALSALVIIFFIFFYEKIFAITFDDSFARATGTRAGLYNFLLAIVIAVIIVLAMNLVGSLLISALIIFPALSSMRLCKSFKGVTILSAILAIVCAAIGLLVSIVEGTPVGSTIVVVDLLSYLICSAIHYLKGGFRT